MSYRFQVASDVVRDGLGVELIDETNDTVAEIFRNDSTHELVFSAYVADIPFVEIEKLVSMARRELQEFEDGSPLPEARV